MSRVIQLSFRLLVVLCLVSAAVTANAQEGEKKAPQQVAPVNLADAAKSAEVDGSLQAKASLLFGFNIGENIKRQGMELDIEKLIEGIKLSAEDQELPMDKEEAQSVMMAFQQVSRKKAREKQMRLAKENLARGQAFLEENGKREGVKVLDNGVQYEVLTDGEMDAKSPAPTDWVKVNYKGMLPDGTQFDASDEGEPAEFPVGGVIRGFSAALMKMKVGDKWKVVIPAEMGYGMRGSPPRIGPNETWIFEVEMVEVIEKDQESAPGGED